MDISSTNFLIPSLSKNTKQGKVLSSDKIDEKEPEKHNLKNLHKPDALELDFVDKALENIPVRLYRKKNWLELLQTPLGCNELITQLGVVYKLKQIFKRLFRKIKF